MKGKRRGAQTVPSLLESLRDDVLKHGQFVAVEKNFDVYLATLKSSFVKSYDFARLAHRAPVGRADERSFLFDGWAARNL